jgi:hypothetical protein
MTPNTKLGITSPSSGGFMKPDPDLLRRIVLDIVNNGIPQTFKPKYPDVDNAVVDWHTAHLIKTGFLKGSIMEHLGVVHDVAITDIEPKGYELATALENDTTWNRVKDWSTKIAVPATATAIFEYLKTLFISS